MCLGVPMRIVERDGARARAELGGVTCEVRLDFLPEARLGDHVIVHAGFALERVDPEEAARTLALIAEVARAGEPAGRGGPDAAWMEEPPSGLEEPPCSS
jgi:hydrogenase expression/formation protein HypC